MAKTAAGPKRAKKSKKKIDPAEVAKRKQKRGARSLFRRLGFVRIPSNRVQFTFQNRTGEIDDVFVYENILVNVEYTTGKNTTAHVFKKKVLFDLIEGNAAAWLPFASGLYPRLKEFVAKKPHSPTEYQVRTLYLSAQATSEEVQSQCPSYVFPDATTLKYFDALSKTIHSSARNEFLKYLRIPFAKIGDAIHSSASTRKEFNGYLLPETFSSFPPSFKVVSFYADPQTLLATSYVLRKDSWMDAEGLYQRVLIGAKIRSMRRYLTTQHRVFVNNIIATLPTSTTINDPENPGKNLNPKDLLSVSPVVLSVPFAFNTVGIVDGQHRVFCYHEGRDKFEQDIAKLRTRQNLLVTGIIYPRNYSEAEKRQFEAKLFLEINDTQTRAKSALRQSIELLLNPYSTIAIAKAVVQGLAGNGPLKGLLQTNYFDPPTKIKTASIVSYGLRPLVKLEGSDTLFAIWSEASKQLLVDPSGDSGQQLLKKYVTFSVECINNLLEGARVAYGVERWKLPADSKHNILSPTSLNGLFVCLRLLIENDKVPVTSKYPLKFSGLGSFKFGAFKSSQWRALGQKLFASYF